jgi:hypothetical protein
MWGWNELNQARSQQHAEACFEISASEFSAIDNETVRRDALNRLQLARSGDPAAHPLNRPAYPQSSASQIAA